MDQNPRLLFMLGQHNPIVRRGLDLFLAGQVDWYDMLVSIVRALEKEIFPLPEDTAVFQARLDRLLPEDFERTFRESVQLSKNARELQFKLISSISWGVAMHDIITSMKLEKIESINILDRLKRD